MKKLFTTFLTLLMIMSVGTINIFADEHDADVSISVIGSEQMTDDNNVNEDKVSKVYNVELGWSGAFAFKYKFNQNNVSYDPDTLTYVQADDANIGWYVGDNKTDNIAFYVSNKSNDAVKVTPSFTDVTVTNTTVLSVIDDEAQFAATNSDDHTTFTLDKASTTEIGVAGQAVTKNLKLKVAGVPTYVKKDEGTVRAILHLTLQTSGSTTETGGNEEEIDLNNITNLTGLAWKGNNKMRVHLDESYDVTFTTHDLNGTEVSGKALQFNSGYGYLMPSQIENNDYWYSLMQFIDEYNNNIIFNNALGVQYGSWTSNDNDYTPTSELNQQQETPSQGNPTTGGTAGGASGGSSPILDAVENPLIHQNPVIGGGGAAAGGGQELGPHGEDPRPTPEEPEPYPGQHPTPGKLSSSMINETAWYKLTVYPSGMEGSEKCDGYIYFTGGADATNTELISWLQANGTFSIPDAE